ncbi:hypothetical protein BN1723_012635 [Verticillium longisporum]|uniref:Rad50/SbcC-type AAA domain-containing protein n=1 Tax=Verticillium longisporum TaxID=100787 RepID=A0A0G4LJN0_VERLO|nr:hypothetical protein BN1723_012635 [Verticillium longisporum]
MSSLKRSHRAISNLDSANVIGVEQASSSFSNDAARKRVRVSVGRPVKPTAPREPSTVSEESEQSAGEESRNGRDSPPRTQYEIMRDGGFRHLENEELDDQRATQAINARSHRVGDNRAAENGIIENVECINFMCHERLYVELGPLINFIVGENGSGKSAVLTALTLCLGAKASSTNRGGSLKSFIKEGRDQAVITSFSSICMLLAIWEAMGSPLRCLDEFDVFMDNVNRTISTKMLIDAARRSVSRQYIMITPNAIEGRASLGKDVNIIRLTDPRQRTLPQMT